MVSKRKKRNDFFESLFDCAQAPNKCRTLYRTNRYITRKLEHDQRVARDRAERKLIGWSTAGSLTRLMVEHKSGISPVLQAARQLPPCDRLRPFAVTRIAKKTEIKCLHYLKKMQVRTIRITTDRFDKIERSWESKGQIPPRVLKNCTANLETIPSIVFFIASSTFLLLPQPSTESVIIWDSLADPNLHSI